MITYCRRKGSCRVIACHLTCIPYLPRTCQQQSSKKQMRTYCIVYADNLAICCHSVESLQACLDNLLDYCTSNLLKVNVSKLKCRKYPAIHTNYIISHCTTVKGHCAFLLRFHSLCNYLFRSRHHFHGIVSASWRQ